MGLISYPVPGKEKSRLICRAFEAGAPKHATGSVFFGTEGVMDAFQRAKSGTWWYIDNAYFDRCRGTYFRVTKNALQVNPWIPIERMDIVAQESLEAGKPSRHELMRPSTGERFRKLGIVIKPWRDNPAGKIIVCPQSDSFMKSTLGRPGNWTLDTQLKLRGWGYGPERWLVRPWERNKTLAYQTLHEQLRGAALVVTWSSASAITALLEGVPAISESGAAHALTGGLSAQHVLNPRRPSIEERTRFCAVLADNQFTLDEFRDGTAWRWLERNGQQQE